MSPLSFLYSSKRNNLPIKTSNALVYIILMSFMAQFLVAPVVSAGSVKLSNAAREYTYTRYSTVSDDSWIGTPKTSSSGSGTSSTSSASGSLVLNSASSKSTTSQSSDTSQVV